MADSLWQTEKLPIDVLAKIFTFLLLARGRAVRCGVCSKPYSKEVKNADLGAVRQTCRRWHRAWNRFVVSAMGDCLSRQPILCFSPHTCVADYLQRAPMTPYILTNLAENKRQLRFFDNRPVRRIK